ncbi:hypothetical protein BSUW23_03830 [Bacillus spizizenii str. W23]|uniref:Uncharacterized protein n=1 Tax=Bacillus spizizenii (strain ATCC 23059 / NRRL B-14472 / W23) TaxID=655816 RepID=E0TVH6_BACSH|nr:hypothetical protein BSUW23_03830 [Bacillus spizizenii str. W23]EFG91809.1 hypothetical protein BSU6633_12087 [Bacillus spizizenii ATCC 6633 = JCM 2499]
MVGTETIFRKVKIKEKPLRGANDHELQPLSVQAGGMSNAILFTRTAI